MNCQHPECDCVNASISRNGKQYCSEACATSASAGEPSCGCDHPGCSASHDTSRMEMSSVGAEDDALQRSGSPSASPRARAASSTSGGQAPRRPESGSASPSPLPPSPDDRGRRKDIGSESDRSDSSKRPDVAPGKSGGPRL